MKKLFSEFPKTSKEDWEKILIKELKGADFNTVLNRFTIRIILLNSNGSFFNLKVNLKKLIISLFI